MIGWGHMVNLVWSEEEEGISTEPRIGLAFEDWLTGYAMFLAVPTALLIFTQMVRKGRHSSPIKMEGI